jgi:alkylation response protein AidB-like acyl-CoA dehydrogenase
MAEIVSLGSVPVSRFACLDRSIVLGDADLSMATVIARAETPATFNSARLLTAAMLVGIAEAVTAMITEYAKIRHTFGRPIGSYQAVRHPIAEMMTRAFAARQQLFLASVSFRDGTPDAPMQIAGVKMLANDASVLNADANIQLHGGIATTDEHDAHYYMKRANVLARLFGGKALANELNAMAFTA